MITVFRYFRSVIVGIAVMLVSGVFLVANDPPPVIRAGRPVKLTLKSGFTLEGKIALLEKIDEKFEDVGKTKIRLIQKVDDGLRYTYFPKYNVARPPIDARQEPTEIFRTRLDYTSEGSRLFMLGEYNNFVSFDKYGRRLLTIPHPAGVDYFTQTIAELTPTYLRIQSNHRNSQPIYWDMRLATNSVPKSQLTPILMNLIDPKKLEDRMRIVRFFIQTGLYETAVEELDRICNEFTDDPEINDRLSSAYRIYRERSRQTLLEELELRWQAGQYQYVKRQLEKIERDDTFPEQQILTVQRLTNRYAEFDKKRQETIASLESLNENLPADEKDDRVPAILAEIAEHLSLYNVNRLATYHLFAEDPNLSASEKLAMAITGWYAGPTANNRRLTVAVALREVQKNVRRYLQAVDPTERQSIIDELKKSEAASPILIAHILAYIKPPKEISKNEIPKTINEKPGLYHFEVDNPLAEPVPKIKYSVQLPPEYDPNRRYPMIVALNGLTQTLEMEIDWWAGNWRGTERTGHAARYGYIVIAPDWNPDKKFDYDFSGFTHAAVLYTTRDAFRRFSVDTDRVFLMGHGIGGTAAWDIGLAHPDIWAGVMPFNALAIKYIEAYYSNAEYVPLYLVSGELEGYGANRAVDINAFTYNRYLSGQAKPYDAMLIRYIGRGIEGFSDEILRMFEWMKVHPRRNHPAEFEVVSLRFWDNYFWNVELGPLAQDLPDRELDPIFWTTQKVQEMMKKAVRVKWSVKTMANSIAVTVSPRLPNLEIFLTPDTIDFNQRTKITVNDKEYQPKNGFVEPDVHVLLEDARSRSDRIRPFWVRLTSTTRK